MSEKRGGDDEQMLESSDHDKVMDSLLVSLHEQPSEREQRVQRLLAKYPQPGDNSRIRTPTKARTHNHATLFRARKSRVRIVLVLAAMMLVTCGVYVSLIPPSAQAALSRAATVLNRPVTRIFDVEITTQGVVQETRELSAKLYRQSTERFLLNFENARVEPCIVAGNPQRRWIRFGLRTWQSDNESNEGFPNDVWFDLASIRQLHFSKLIDELPRGYDLRWLNDAMLPGDSKLMYRIEAVRQKYDPSMPKRVVLWIDPNSDMTQQIEVSMHVADFSVIRSFVARFREEVPPNEAFFQLESHR
ncbi:MAG: hypothetical protein CMM01_05865 [Rhodopirellula sp.]|nr:hypothetical protein [Rhodopirellula sp.]OUX52119.1 MAG: hypothetical protein CBE43_01425 [Rhodopirellula sp. TMED283]